MRQAPPAPEGEGASCQEETSCQVAVVVHEEPWDKAENLAEALISAKRLEQLKDIRARTLEARVPAAFFAVDREVSQLERGFAAKGPRKQANYVLRRAVEQASLKETAALVKKRESLLKLKLAKKAAENKAAKAKVVAIAEKAASKVAKGKVLKLAKKLQGKLSAAKNLRALRNHWRCLGPRRLRRFTRRASALARKVFATALWFLSG